jgi:hypothetical protein
LIFFFSKINQFESLDRQQIISCLRKAAQMQTTREMLNNRFKVARPPSNLGSKKGFGLKGKKRGQNANVVAIRAAPLVLSI